MSTDAEVAALGVLLQDFRLWHRAASLIRPDDFSIEHGQLVAQAIAKRADAGGDYTALETELPSLAYVSCIRWVADAGFAEFLERYAETVAEQAKRRRILRLCAEVGAAKLEAADELLTRLNVGLEAIQTRRKASALTFNQVIERADEHILTMKELAEPCVPTGIPSIDARTGGLPKSRLIVIAARPSIGKSALLNQIALHAARRGYPGLVCSLEMSEVEIGIRALAHVAQVNVTKLNQGAGSEHDGAMRRYSELCALPLYVDTETYGLDAICAQIAEHKRLHGIQWAAVDHIGLVETGSGYNTRNDQLGVVTRTLKKLAKRLELPIIAVSQLNRGVEKDRRRPVLADLRDSGNIEQDADIALFLHSESEDTVADPVIQLGLLKNRAGRRGWIDARIEFAGATQTFREISNVRPLREPVQHYTDGDAA